MVVPRVAWLGLVVRVELALFWALGPLKYCPGSQPRGSGAICPFAFIFSI